MKKYTVKIIYSVEVKAKNEENAKKEAVKKWTRSVLRPCTKILTKERK